MPISYPFDLDRVDQEIRINELKEQARELAGGDLNGFEAEDAPPELIEGFWRHVVDYESAPQTTCLQKLTDAGVVLPPPDEMGAAALAAKLRELFAAAAKMNVFFCNTDHLSDRELYVHLWDDMLREEMADLPFHPDGAHHFDILGGCSVEDMFLHNKHYADDEERARWMQEFPDYDMPPHVDLPYDRDRHLPKDRRPGCG